MKKIIHAHKRLTFEYNDGWRGEDQQEYVGEFHVLSSRILQNDDSARWFMRIKLPRPMPVSAVENVINNELGGGCTHEHDCCGCWSFYVVGVNKPRGKRRMKREVIVTLSGYCNV